MLKVKTRVIVLSVLPLLAAVAHGNPTISDAQHLAMYNECQAKQHIDILGVANFVADIVTANAPAFVGDWAESLANGYRDHGCNAFLTDAQLWF